MTFNPFQRGLGQPARASSRFNSNQTGSTVPKGIPVRLTVSGIDLIDVSQESHVDALAGVLSADAPDASNASIITSGTIESIVTSFSVGDSVYISKVGLLTNSKPTTGVGGFGEGDFVIKIGMIAKNNDNPSNKDLIVGIQIMGQL